MASTRDKERETIQWYLFSDLVSPVKETLKYKNRTMLIQSIQNIQNIVSKYKKLGKSLVAKSSPQIRINQRHRTNKINDDDLS